MMIGLGLGPSKESSVRIEARTLAPAFVRVDVIVVLPTIEVAVETEMGPLIEPGPIITSAYDKRGDKNTIEKVHFIFLNIDNHP